MPFYKKTLQNSIYTCIILASLFAEQLNFNDDIEKWNANDLPTGNYMIKGYLERSLSFLFCTIENKEHVKNN